MRYTALFDYPSYVRDGNFRDGACKKKSGAADGGKSIFLHPGTAGRRGRA